MGHSVDSWGAICRTIKYQTCKGGGCRNTVLNHQVGVQRLDGLLCSIPRSENILQIHNEDGYNLLQICVGLNNLELIRWCLSRNIDINRGACSLPLHIACLKG